MNLYLNSLYYTILKDSTTKTTTTTTTTTEKPPNTPSYRKKNTFVINIKLNRIVPFLYLVILSIFLLFVAGPLCRKTIGAAVNLKFSRELIGKTDTFDICAMSRRGRYREANGVTWHKDEHFCWFTFKANNIRKEEICCEACILDGKI